MIISEPLLSLRSFFSGPLQCFDDLRVLFGNARAFLHHGAQRNEVELVVVRFARSKFGRVVDEKPARLPFFVRLLNEALGQSCFQANIHLTLEKLSISIHVGSVVLQQTLFLCRAWAHFTGSDDVRQHSRGGLILFGVRAHWPA